MLRSVCGGASSPFIDKRLPLSAAAITIRKSKKQEDEHSMRISLAAALIAALSLSCSAFAQQPASGQKPTGGSSAGATLPPDIDPVSLTRLPPLKRADLDDEGKAIYDKIVGDKPAPATGPVPMSLYSPKIAAPINELNGFLRYNGDLSPRHTEVAICVATWEIEQQYEYSSHEPAALRFGAPQEVIDTIKYNREPKGLSPEETLIIKLGRDLMRKHKVDSDLYAQAVKLFGKKGVVELVTVMGDYVMVGMVLTTIDQHLPPDRPARLPPR
jgi:4-carboxymuconolactone decarboxylase